MLNGLDDGVGKLKMVVAGAFRRRDAAPKVAGRLAQNGQFREAEAGMALLAAALDVIAADVVALKAGRVDGAFRLVADQAANVSMSENRTLESVKSPFFSSRAWVFCSVV